MRHGIPRERHKWNQASDIKLLDAVKRYGNNNWSVGENLVLSLSILPSYTIGQSLDLCQKMPQLLNVKVDTPAWIQHLNGGNGQRTKMLVLS
jgi:hypothetical protein